MTTMERINLLAQHNGKQAVDKLLIDELYELIEAIEKGEGITQEKADVINLIYQHTILEGDMIELDEQIDYKVNRAIERLGI